MSSILIGLILILILTLLVCSIVVYSVRKNEIVIACLIVSLCCTGVEIAIKVFLE